METSSSKLAEGLVKIHRENFSEIETRIDDLSVKQENIARELETQNCKLEEGMNSVKFCEMVSLTKEYLEKLQSISKQMHSLTDRATKVKKRALRLQAEKQHQDLERERQRELEAEREKQLIARPAKRH